MSNSLQARGLQHARFFCPPLSSGVCSNSCPFNWWCYLIISSSATPFSCLPSFQASRSFPVSPLFTSCGQSIRSSALASVLPINIQGWFHSGLTGLISLLFKGVFSLLQHHNSKASILHHSAFCFFFFFHLFLLVGTQPSYDPTCHICTDYWENHSFDYSDVCLQSDISAFQYAAYVSNSFFPRGKHLSIPWLQSPSTVNLGSKKIKPGTTSTFSPINPE